MRNESNVGRVVALLVCIAAGAGCYGSHEYDAQDASVAGDAGTECQRHEGPIRVVYPRDASESLLSGGVGIPLSTWETCGDWVAWSECEVAEASRCGDWIFLDVVVSGGHVAASIDHVDGAATLGVLELEPR